MKFISIFLFLGTILTKVKNETMVAIGDLHGDYNRAIKAYQVAGVIDKNKKWIAHSTILYQLGDVLDRKPNTIKLYQFIIRIQNEALNYNSKVVLILGNHELMNLQGTYISHDKKNEMKQWKSMQEREKVFGKNGWIGKFLRTCPLVERRDRTVFVHGGIHPDWAVYGITKLNKMARDHLQKDSMKALKKADIFQRDDEIETWKKKLVNGKWKKVKHIKKLKRYNTPLWYRGFSEPKKVDCKKLKESLRLLKADRMIMGHTVTRSHKIESQCNGRAIMIDTGISGFYSKDGGRISALKISRGIIRALYENNKSEIIKPKK